MRVIVVGAKPAGPCPVNGLRGAAAYAADRDERPEETTRA